jgi:hypothetical protein
MACGRERQPLDWLGALTRSTVLRVILSLSKDELVERASGTAGFGDPALHYRNLGRISTDSPGLRSKRLLQLFFCVRLPFHD